MDSPTSSSNKQSVLSGLREMLQGCNTSLVGENISKEDRHMLSQASFEFYRKYLFKHVADHSLDNRTKSCDICRICRESASREDLITPCSCRGTMRFIHMSCLEHWLAESDTAVCELCAFKYQTVRTPKYGLLRSILLWLHNPGHRRDTHELMIDTVALIVFTPMAVFGTYMALLVGENWYNTEDATSNNPVVTRMVTLACIGVIGAIDAAFMSWLTLRMQHHVRTWYKWWRKNSVVKVILTQEDEEKCKKIEEEETNVMDTQVD